VPEEVDAIGIMLKKILTGFFILVLLAVQGCGLVPLEHGKEIFVGEYSDPGHGVLKLTCKMQAWGPLGGGWYRKRPLLYFNGALIISDFVSKRKSFISPNALSFPIDPEVLNSLRYRDYRNDLKRNGYMKKVWYVFVDPDKFSENDFNDIVTIYGRHEKEIDKALSEMNMSLRDRNTEKFAGIGAIAYARQFMPVAFTKYGYTILVSPNGRCCRVNQFPGTTSMGSPSGDLYVENGVMVFEVPYVSRKIYEIYGDGSLGTLTPYDPYFIGDLENDKGESIRDLYELKLMPEK
ncbi:MAG: hypothetical protein PHQ61_08445, partial [Candidatus Omnitrophica bacterium]|nr:hypothetical protein [Candidatus Omnitrophota bacterium]